MKYYTKVKLSRLMLLSVLFAYQLSSRYASSNERTDSQQERISIDIEIAADLARKQAEAILAATSAIEAIEQQGRGELSPFYPQLRADASYTRNEELTTVPFGSFGDIETGRRNDYRGGLHASQSLWSFGRRKATRQRTRETTAIAKTDLRVAKRDVAFRARNAVVHYLFEQSRLHVATERVQQRKDEFQDAEDLREAGIVNDLDVRQASINLIQAKDDRERIDADFRQAKEDVAAAIAMSADDIIITAHLVRPDSVLDLLNRARVTGDNDVDIQRLQSRYDEVAAERHQTTADYYPELSAVADGTTDGDAIDDMQEAWGVGLTLAWDLYAGGNRKSRKAALSHRLDELQYRQNERRREVRREIDQLEIQLNSLNIRIELEQEAVRLAEQNYNDAREQYRAGLITLTRLGEINLQITEARFRYIALIYDEQTVGNQLRRLIE